MVGESLGKTYLEDKIFCNFIMPHFRLLGSCPVANYASAVDDGSRGFGLRREHWDDHEGD